MAIDPMDKLQGYYLCQLANRDAEIKRLRKVIKLYQNTCVHTRRTAYRTWIGSQTGEPQPIHVDEMLRRANLDMEG